MDIVNALKDVPEVQLRIIPLTWKLVNKDGTISREKITLYTKELEGALQEAEAYSKATLWAIGSLKKLLH